MNDLNDYKSVVAWRTGFVEYSHGWKSEANYPEYQALAAALALTKNAQHQTLFERTIKPGDQVVIKPNLVRDWHPDGADLYSIITHPAVIRAVIDQTYQALQGEGRIIIADAPMGDADFDHLVKVTQLDQISEYYWRKYRFQIDIRDLRKYRYRYEVQRYGYGHEVQIPLKGAPDGYATVDLGGNSAFRDLTAKHLLEGTDVARRKETIQSKTDEQNYYLIAKEVLNADVLIHIPKLKVHSKVGITINCKGMVGINGDKNLLPHFRWGGASEGGDQFPQQSQRPEDQTRMRVGRWVADNLLADQSTWWRRGALWAVQTAGATVAKVMKFKTFDPVNGDWHGNDTCWRLAADLIRVALFADRDGIIRNVPQRRFISVVDGIIGGENNGPLRPTPKPAGVLIIGEHPIAVDLVCSRLMGMDHEKIRYLRVLIQDKINELRPHIQQILPNEIQIASNVPAWEQLFSAERADLLNFQPPPRWVGKLEFEPSTPN